MSLTLAMGRRSILAWQAYLNDNGKEANKIIH
jgi:hypothetical protein